MKSSIKEILENLGFEEREVTVYIHLIRHPVSTALRTARATRIDRTTIYDILEKMIDKGIVSVTTINKTKCYSALTPDELYTFYKEKLGALKAVMGTLKKQATVKAEEPVCEVFNGISGLRTLIKDYTETRLPYKAIGIREEYEEVLGYLAKSQVKQLSELKVKETAIVERGAKFTKMKHAEYRYLDNPLNAPLTTQLYGDTVIFYMWTDPYFAIRIKNKVFAKAIDDYFRLIWKVAKNKKGKTQE